MIPDYLLGCETSLTGMHIYEKVPPARKDAEENARCRSCSRVVPKEHRVAILTFLEEAEKQRAEEAEQRKKAKEAYLRAGKVVR